MEKLKILVDIFAKIAVCVLFASAIYIPSFWGLEATISVQILWQIIIVSAICSLPILMYPVNGEKELSKKGMIVRQIIYFAFVNCAVLGFGRAFGWFYFKNPDMVAFMEILIVAVYAVMNLAAYMKDRRVADDMNRKLEELRNANSNKNE
jgi:hypothetical protein